MAPLAGTRATHTGRFDDCDNSNLAWRPTIWTRRLPGCLWRIVNGSEQTTVTSDGLVIARTRDMKAICLLAFVSLSAGCARTGAPPVQPESAASLQAASQPQTAGELRHFYLLSPGPNATLVLTRSDLSAH